MGSKDVTNGSSRSSGRITPRSDEYFLECRKDALCHCNMCKASIHATLDLRVPGSRVCAPITNSVPASPSVLDNNNCPSPSTPCPSPFFLSNRSSFHHQLRHTTGCISNSEDPKHRYKKCIGTSLRWILLMTLCLTGMCAYHWAASCVWEIKLDSARVAKIAAAAMARRNLLDRLDLVQGQLSRVVANSLYNCTGRSSHWTLAEGRWFVRSSCELYISPMERVSVWGYAGKTGGVLGCTMVDRTFIVLSGRVIEWEEGRMQYVVHSEAEAWHMPKWRASVILLGGNTWVLEYSRTPLSHGYGEFLLGLLHVAYAELQSFFENIKLSFDVALGCLDSPNGIPPPS